jgi:hypothetical protein
MHHNNNNKNESTLKSLSDCVLCGHEDICGRLRSLLLCDESSVTLALEVEVPSAHAPISWRFRFAAAPAGLNMPPLHPHNKPSFKRQPAKPI